MSDYEVGHGKPPVAHRFSAQNQPKRRGRKPNPKLDGRAIARAVSNQEIVVQEGTRTRRMTRNEALVRQLRARGLKGDISAMLNLLRLRREAEITELEPIAIYLNRSQMKG